MENYVVLSSGNVIVGGQPTATTTETGTPASAPVEAESGGFGLGFWG